jgi:hypothetical protein
MTAGITDLVIIFIGDKVTNTNTSTLKDRLGKGQTDANPENLSYLLR